MSPSQLHFKRAIWTGILSAFLGFCLFVPAALPPGQQSVGLAWTASSDPNVAGYFLYYWVASGLYTGKIDVGTNTTFTFGGLLAWQTNYFFMTSYDSSGAEGPTSTGLTYITPGILTASLSPTNGAIKLSFPVAPGYSYELQASSDLKTWSNIWASSSTGSNAWVDFSEPVTNSIAARFYRLVGVPSSIVPGSGGN